jgi:hypothetical protein
MSFLRPAEDGFTPLRRSRADIFAGAEEGLRRMALDLGAQDRARREAKQPRAAVETQAQMEDLDEELEGLVTDAAAAATSPIQDLLTLRHDGPKIDLCWYFGAVMGDALADYPWWNEQHFNDVCHWVTGLDAAGQQQLKQFFRSHIIDRYHYDRALRAAEKNGLGMPVRFEDLRQTVKRSGEKFRLTRVGFSWSRDVPPSVTNMLTQVVTSTPADEYWIGKYVARTVYDPIIYAEFGEPNSAEAWHVEVARWGDEADDPRVGTTPYSGARR